MVEALDSGDLTIQFNIARPHVKNLLKGLLAEIRGIKYQIALQVTLHKEIGNYELKYAPPIYFNSRIQTIKIYIYNPLEVSLCMQFPEQLRHVRKGLIGIQNKGK